MASMDRLAEARESTVARGSDRLAERDEIDYRSKCHDDYLAERKMLIEGEFDSGRSLDKYLTSLASGALGLSLVFLDRVRPDPAWTWVLVAAWVFFASCLTCVLVGLLYNQDAYRVQRDILEEICSGDESPNCDNRPARISRCLSKLGIASFILAVILLLTFAYGSVWNSTVVGR